MFLLLFLGFNAFANLEDLTQKLVTLRGDVEVLAQEIETLKKTQQSALDSLVIRQANLESDIQKESFRKKQMETRISEIKNEVSKKSVGDEELVSVINDALDELNHYLSLSLPFNLEKRNQEVAKIKSDLNAKLIAPHAAAAKLWSFMEDELRLSKENTLLRQTITINDQQMLASVAKLGAMYLYFKTDSGLYGLAQWKNSKWEYLVLEDEVDQKNISDLMNSMKQQVRIGYFVLPIPQIRKSL